MFMYRQNGQRLRSAAVAAACWCVLLSFWSLLSTMAFVFGSPLAKKMTRQITEGFPYRQLPTKLVASSSSTSTTRTLAMAALTLYGNPGTRSPLVNWACYELGVDFTMASDLSQNPHPFGQLPCLTDHDEDNNDSEMIVLFESGAILQYLLRYYSDSGSQPKLTKAQQAAIISWITWANASLDPICFLETPDGKVYDTGLKKPNRCMQRLNDILSRQQYLVAEASSDRNESNSIFTIADVAVASYLLYVLQFFPDTDLQSQWPHVVRYLKDCASRPAYGQAFGDRVQSYLVLALSEQQQKQKPDSKKLFGMF